MSDLEQWLSRIGLDQYAPLFREHCVDLAILADFEESDCKELGIPLGHRKKLLKAIIELRSSVAAHPDSTSSRPDTDDANASSQVERRQLTVMFCDLVASTDLAARLDPEDMREVIRGYQECCGQAIAEFDGFVVQYLGDGILAYFGYPRAHEDDAERAIRSGMRILAQIPQIKVRDQRLQVRIGVATGLVVIGDIVGQGLGHQEAATGKTPNLAARLQAEAKPGTIVVSDSTRNLAGGVFEYADLGVLPLKGLTVPERAWQVIGGSQARSRFEAARSTALTPLVGREEELSLVFSRWRIAAEGEGQVVLISGEPGIGKSRVAIALIERIVSDPHLLLQYHCSPYHANSAFYPIVQNLEREAGFAPGDTVDAKLSRLQALLPNGIGNPVEASELLGAMLLLPLGARSPAGRMSPTRQKDETTALLADMVIVRASHAPVLLVVEDVHWMDPTTIAVVDLIVDRAREARILVLITYRPEFSPRWVDRAHVRSLVLGRLSRKQTATIVQSLASDASLPREILDQIVSKTDGIPLFVEELAKTVMEAHLMRDQEQRVATGVPLSSITLPATLRDSLTARLDHLASAKGLAQIAAVVGREFDYRLLAAVANLDEKELQEALAKLGEAGLLLRRSGPQATHYYFKHALVQEAAYESLLKARRQQLHLRVAQAIEQHFSELQHNEPEVLARHYTLGSLAEKAIPYWLRAGERARARSAYTEALAHFNQGRELLAQLPPTPEAAQIEINLLTALGPVLQVVKGQSAAEVQALYTSARELCERAGTARQLFAVTFNMWTTKLLGGQLAIATKMSGELSSNAAALADSGLMLQAQHTVWAANFYSGNLRVALAAAEEGRRIYDPEAHHGHKFIYGAHDPKACASAFGAQALWLLGYPDSAQSAKAAAAEYMQQLGHPFTLALNGSAVLTIDCFNGDLQVVRETADKIIELSEREGFPVPLAWARALHGWTLALNGVAEGVEVIDAA